MHANPSFQNKDASSLLIRRTPSTSAIYETLRRSKELRESLSSRPSSRLSIDNGEHHMQDKFRDSVSCQVDHSQFGHWHLRVYVSFKTVLKTVCSPCNRTHSTSLILNTSWCPPATPRVTGSNRQHRIFGACATGRCPRGWKDRPRPPGSGPSRPLLTVVTRWTGSLAAATDRTLLTSIQQVVYTYTW